MSNTNSATVFSAFDSQTPVLATSSAERPAFLSQVLSTVNPSLRPVGFGPMRLALGGCDVEDGDIASNVAEHGSVEQSTTDDEVDPQLRRIPSWDNLNEQYVLDEPDLRVLTTDVPDSPISVRSTASAWLSALPSTGEYLWLDHDTPASEIEDERHDCDDLDHDTPASEIEDERHDCDDLDLDLVALPSTITASPTSDRTPIEAWVSDDAFLTALPSPEQNLPLDYGIPDPESDENEEPWVVYPADHLLPRHSPTREAVSDDESLTALPYLTPRSRVTLPVHRRLPASPDAFSFTFRASPSLSDSLRSDLESEESSEPWIGEFLTLMKRLDEHEVQLERLVEQVKRVREAVETCGYVPRRDESRNF
ncbi:MAG: hypothetical protein M1828_002387 [Chrysothrix sp. TS-e1954]|nr:MAG: hypothetical protein M1828_002387 [Chrysothrix sp. TS-e1954]